MPLEESFVKELEELAEADFAEKSEEPSGESEENSDATDGTEASDDVAAEAVDGEDGDTGSETANVDAATSESSDGTGEGTGDSDESSSEPKLEKPTLSESLLEEAVKHGFSLAEARNFPSDSSLNQAIQAVRMQIAANLPEKEEEPEEDILAGFPELNPDEFDEDTFKAVTALKESLYKQHAEIKALKENTARAQQEYAQANQAAAAQEITTWFDGQVAALGDDFKEVLGSGGTDALVPGSTAFNKRAEIGNHIAALMESYDKLGVSKPRDEIFYIAARSVLNKEFAQIEQRKITDQVKKQKKKEISRGTGQSKGKVDADPRAEAVKILNEKFGI